MTSPLLRRPCFLLVIMWIAFVATTLRAQDKPPATLKVGDPAPPLRVSKWLKGGPIEKLEKGKVYVMEFWATWCGPCVAGMPHVTQLQKKYADKGVVVIGMNVGEHDPSKSEPVVARMGDRIGYAVAADLVEGDNPGVM